MTKTIPIGKGHFHLVCFDLKFIFILCTFWLITAGCLLTFEIVLGIEKYPKRIVRGVLDVNILAISFL